MQQARYRAKEAHFNAAAPVVPALLRQVTVAARRKACARRIISGFFFAAATLE